MIYAVIHTDNGDALAQYDGMSVETVSALIADLGFTFTVLAEDEYRQRIAAIQHEP